MGESPEEMLRRVSAENALLAAENKKLRAELEAYKGLLGQWVQYAEEICVSVLELEAGDWPLVPPPPEKPEGV